MPAPQPSPTEQVTAHLARLAPELAATVEFVRQTLLAADPRVAEHIKWNSPSFHFTGELPPHDAKEYLRDLVVINLHRGRVLLVFPTGARIPADSTHLLEGTYPDGRRLLPLADLTDARAKAPALQALVRAWIAAVAG